jgi:hypothetical protein
MGMKVSTEHMGRLVHEGQSSKSWPSVPLLVEFVGALLNLLLNRDRHCRLLRPFDAQGRYVGSVALCVSSLTDSFKPASVKSG